ncbi:MAG TPA: SemiSWEET family transporter [Caulobacteraceae bacterium]|nr:SemiSWEET family transporter [Caulobacteraceae bacterium]
MPASLATDAVGAAAAALSIASFAPQIVKMLRTRDASGVSLRTYALTVTCFCLWVVYGVRLGAWPITLANAAALAMSATVLALKWRLRRRRRSQR